MIQLQRAGRRLLQLSASGGRMVVLRVLQLLGMNPSVSVAVAVFAALEQPFSCLLRWSSLVPISIQRSKP